MPQKSSFVSYPAFTFHSAEFGNLLSDRMNISMLEDTRRALEKAKTSDPTDVVNILISRLVETEENVDLTEDMATRLSQDEREAFASAYLNSESLISKEGPPRSEDESATNYLGSNFALSIDKALAPPAWWKDIQPPKWAKPIATPAWASAIGESSLAKQLQAPDWSKKFGNFLGDDALSALGRNEDLFKAMKNFDAKVRGVAISPEQMERFQGIIPEHIPNGESRIPRSLPELSLQDFPSQARITNDKLSEVIGRLSELKEFEGQSVEVIRNIGVVADTLFQRFTENAIASQASAEANNRMARDSLEASRSNVKLARGALWTSATAIFVAIILGFTPIVLQRWQAPDDEKKAETTIVRVLRQIDAAQSGVAAAVRDMSAQQGEASAHLEQRVLDLLDELRRSRVASSPPRSMSRRDE